MRKITLLKEGFEFTGKDNQTEIVNLPHTWNSVGRMDGGDYYRGTCTYRKSFPKPEFDPAKEVVYLEFDGVNASARVVLNGEEVCTHDGGYSTFRKDITSLLKENNDLLVEVDNSANDKVYPQRADFTFYGGIYRDVKLVVVNKTHFEMDHYAGPGFKYETTINADGSAIVHVSAYSNGGIVRYFLLDKEGNLVAEGEGDNAELNVKNAHLWNGIQDPYLYTLKCVLVLDGEEVDEVGCKVGIRSFRFDEKNGFYLNGKSYPLHGVSRHQDRRGMGNAISEKEMDEDMDLIKEIGANTIRLAHYQHNQHFYDLCDEAGMIIWAEIPYISEHLPNDAARANVVSQMHELIIQNYNHPSIVVWGLSNEITIKVTNKKDMLAEHKKLNDMVHKLDATRPTVLACYAMCGPFNPISKITDLVGWNLYLGWYVPFMWLNDVWVGVRHLFYPHIPLCYSEYGAEGMPNLHSAHPKRGDHTEDYQAIYHEYMARFFNKHKYIWANYIWNMFDFAAFARDQGGEAGMNHKGMVTFDRKTKKDSFYLYQSYWREEPMVHICLKRFAKRPGSKTEIKVYSNQPEVTLKINGNVVATKKADHVFKFKVDNLDKMDVEAVAGEVSDKASFEKVSELPDEYKLRKGKSENWC